MKRIVRVFTNRVVAIVLALLWLLAGCRPVRPSPAAAQPSHSLEVRNDWHRDITLSYSAMRLPTANQRHPIGAIAVGATATFPAALPENQERYVFHARYDRDRLEFLTIFLDRSSLEKLGWKIVIPGTDSTC